jgi:hypothetical protein
MIINHVLNIRYIVKTWYHSISRYTYKFNITEMEQEQVDSKKMDDLVQ